MENTLIKINIDGLWIAYSFIMLFIIQINIKKSYIKIGVSTIFILIIIFNTAEIVGWLLG
jgi:hypothetical protein